MTVAAQTSDESLPQFAHVAVPVHLRKLFTYRLPASMQRSAQVGSRVMVQLGPKATAGYIVALIPRLRTGTSLIESEIKDIQELLDVDPPLTPEVLEITRWVADYYAAPWGEVMRAALPAGINASVEQTVSITDEGRRELSTSADQTSVKARALALLADEGEFEINAFALRLGATRVPKWLRELENDHQIERSYRTRKTATRSKRRRAVRIETAIAQSFDENGQQRSRMTAAQKRALNVLKEHHGAMAVSDLVQHANVSESVIKTLLKKGLVTEFEEEL